MSPLCFIVSLPRLQYVIVITRMKRNEATDKTLHKIIQEVYLCHSSHDDHSMDIASLTTVKVDSILCKIDCLITFLPLSNDGRRRSIGYVDRFDSVFVSSRYGSNIRHIHYNRMVLVQSYSDFRKVHSSDRTCLQLRAGCGLRRVAVDRMEAIRYFRRTVESQTEKSVREGITCNPRK